MCFRLYRPRATPASACRGMANPRIRQQQCARHSLCPRQERGRAGDYPACHCNGRWAAHEELEGGTREDTRTWGASVFGERHEFSCVCRRRIEDLAWLLAQEPWIVPIPCTTKLKRLEENIGAVEIELTPDDLREIEGASSRIKVEGARYPEKLEAMTGR